MRTAAAITNAAYVIMKRNFAPPADRLKSLVARERLMPATLVEARKNLDNPPKIYTADRHRADRRQHLSFFKNDVPAAFSRRDRHGAAEDIQADQRQRDGGARRVQDLAAEGSAAEVEWQLCVRSRHLCEGARRQRDDRAAARLAAPDRGSRPGEKRSGIPGRGEADRSGQAGRQGARRHSRPITRRRTSCSM